MARIRTIKPEFPQSESMGRISREARLLFIQLWTLAEDSGRLRASSRMLASLLYPYDNDVPGLIEGWLHELIDQACILWYEIDGHKYIQIENWQSHQRIDHPAKAKIPEFGENSRNLAKICEASRGPPVGSKDLRTRTMEGTKDLRIDMSSEENSIASAWNQMAAPCGLSPIAKITTKRQKLIAARLKEYPIGQIIAALAKIPASDFLLGKKSSNGHAGWKADFDFIMHEDHFAKLCEGHYFDRQPEAKRTGMFA